MRSWFKGFHHLYLGLFLILTGFIIMGIESLNPYIGAIIIFIGIILVIDDFIQHFVQSVYDKNWHSPIHKLYGKIYKYKFIQKLNKIFDKLFGR